MKYIRQAGKTETHLRFDVGSGSLDLVAGSSIVVGVGARLSSRILGLRGGNVNPGGVIDIAAGSSLSLQSVPSEWNTAMLDWTSVTVPSETFPLTRPYLFYPGHDTLTRAPAPIPEPATWLLLLTGLALLVQHDLRRNRRVR